MAVSTADKRQVVKGLTGDLRKTLPPHDQRSLLKQSELLKRMLSPKLGSVPVSGQAASLATRDMRPEGTNAHVTQGGVAPNGLGTDP